MQVPVCPELTSAAVVRGLWLRPQPPLMDNSAPFPTCPLALIYRGHSVQTYRATSVPVGRIDVKRVDAMTEADIARHQAEDDANAMLDTAKFARRVRRRLGFSQVEFAERIDVSLDTIRNWEQGKRCPTGAAKALLKVLDKAPEAALAALH